MTAVTKEFEAGTRKKIIKNLMPLLIICMFISYMDRINIGFAALTMNKDLGLSAAAYGLGAGLFFIGYFLFEVPSNLILEKIGPKIWITRIMITWGIIAIGMAFVQGPTSFYVVRFLLGLAEAGFFPGIVFLFTFWFREKERGQAVAMFLCGSYLGGAIGAPISGLIMTYLQGAMGMHGWQWLYIIEGIPAVILSFFVWKYLPQGPRDVKWLTQEEKDWIINTIDEEKREKGVVEHMSLWKALTNPRTLLLGLIYLCFSIGNLGMSLWIPQLIKTLGKDLSTLSVTLYTMLPYWILIISMLILSRHADRTGERKWHITIACLVAAGGLFVSAGTSSLQTFVIALVVIAGGFGGIQPNLWGASTQILNAKEAAAGIALINSIGNLGGFVGPNIIGIAKQVTGRYEAGVYIFCGCLCLIAVLIQAVYAIAEKQRKSVQN